MTELRFDGRVAIITGAGRGLGQAYALLLASRGASVVVNDLGPRPGEPTSVDVAGEVVRTIESEGGSAIAVHASVATAIGAASIVDTAVERFGRIDILINNAGNAITRSFPELGDEDLRTLLDTHFYGTFYLCRAAWDRMQAAGYGRIVNTVSAALLGTPKWSGYAAAKGAVLGLTLNLATEGLPSGILVNAIAPAAATRLMTDHTENLPQAAVELMTKTMPASSVAPVAAYLAHEKCNLSGEVLTAAAGRVARVTLDITPGWRDSALTIDSVAEHIRDVLAPEGTTRWTVSPG
jgi:NAD(P)-dependent dehydrogenase (short-subunit alcohol dehydrogenase family)